MQSNLSKVHMKNYLFQEPRFCPPAVLATNTEGKQSSLMETIASTGPWKCDVLRLVGNCSTPTEDGPTNTDQHTNQQTDMRVHSEVLLPTSRNIAL